MEFKAPLKFNALKNLRKDLSEVGLENLAPENKEDIDTSQRDMDDYKYAARTNRLPPTYGSGEAEVDDSLLAPDYLLAGAAAPGIQAEYPLLKEHLKRKLADESGVLGQRSAKTIVGQLAEVEPGETIQQVIPKLLREDYGLQTLPGIGAAESEGKSAQQFGKSLKESLEKKGVPIYSGSNQTPTSRKYFQENPNHNGVFSTPEGEIWLNPEVRDPYKTLSVLTHESQHVDDLLQNKIPEKFRNYGEKIRLNSELKPIQSIYETSFPEYKNNKYSMLTHYADDLIREGKIEEGVALLNNLKKNHFGDFKNFELEKSLQPIVQNMDEFTPEEAEFLKNHFPFLDKLRKK